MLKVIGDIDVSEAEFLKEYSFIKLNLCQTIAICLWSFRDCVEWEWRESDKHKTFTKGFPVIGLEWHAKGC